MPSQAVLALRGLPLTGVHVPAEPGSLQASHWPLHSALQQTLSAQNPEVQPVPAVQTEPSAPLGLHSPATQMFPETQWASAAQGWAQAVPRQRYAPQSVPFGSALQLPSPSQTLPFKKLPTQAAELHAVPETYFLQAPAPSQVPSRWQLVVPSSGQSLCGSLPAVANPQTPSSLASSFRAAVQAWQVPEHAVSQQTLSTHCADRHSLSAAQAVPFPFFEAHCPVPMQKRPIAHWASLAQLAGQIPAVQR